MDLLYSKTDESHTKIQNMLIYWNLDRTVSEINRRKFFTYFIDLNFLSLGGKYFEYFFN